MEGCLEEQRLEVRLKKTKLPDGNEMSFTYSEDSSGHVYGWTEIGFRTSGALAARKLQKELYEFLNKRDLIRRIG